MEIQEQLVSYHDRLTIRNPASIDLVVLHCTELPTLQMAREFAERIVNPEDQVGNCGHYYIDRDGALCRYVRDDRIANHVLGYNESSVGIEIVNTGRYPDWYATTTQSPSEPYTFDQIESLNRLLHFLIKEHPGLVTIARHSDLDTRTIPATDDPKREVHRRIDPGPMFPWDEVHRSFQGLIRSR
jgi:N-acetylmuramoyl-L-alanine amidase